MTIEAIANHNQIERVDIQITTTMPLARWKIIQKSLQASLKNDYHGVTAEFEYALATAIQNYSEKVENKIEINN